MTLGENIKRIRIEKELKQSDLAINAKISRVAVGNYERGTRIPNVEILNNIATALGVNINELMGGDTIIEKTFINDKLEKTLSGEISEGDVLEGITKYIKYIASLEGYVLGSEYKDIINSATDLIRGKILILKSNIGNKKPTQY